MIKNKFNSFAYDAIVTFRPNTIDGQCQAKFRLSSKYMDQPAPFGFDWVRTGDSVAYVSFDAPYKGNMGRYYTDPMKTELCKDSSETSHFDVSPHMYNYLCQSFLPGNLMIFPTHDGKMRRYHVPVLSIYPYSSQHPIIAHLALEIQIESNISAIQLEFNKSLLEINTDNSLSPRKGKHVYEISIKCIKEFAQDEYIEVTSINSRGKEKRAGMLRICRNAKPFRFQTNILLVNIKFSFSMEDDDIPFVGDEEPGRKHIECMLHHALISPVFEVLELDLGYDREMDVRLYESGGRHYLLIYKADMGARGEKICDLNFPHLSAYLTEKVKAIKDIEKYSTILYFMGTGIISSLDNNLRVLNGNSVDKYVLLENSYEGSTATHELLHTLGLGHSFDNYLMDDTLAPFTHIIYNTDNIMDYTHINKIERTNLWEWQWDKIREVCTPEGEQL